MRSNLTITRKTIIVALAPLVIFSATAAAAEGKATNPFSPAYGHPYRAGVIPTLTALKKMQEWRSTHRRNTPANTPLINGGGDPESGVDHGAGVVSGEPLVYLVVFGNQWGTKATDANGNWTFSNDSSGEVPYLQEFFMSLGKSGELWSGTMTQYCDGPLVSAGATACPPGAAHVRYPTSTVLAGVWYDNAQPSPINATGTDLGREAVLAAAHFGNVTPSSNRYAQYVILSPPGTHPDGFPNAGFCAWHSDLGDVGFSSSPYGGQAFTNLPYLPDAGGECGRNFVNPGNAGLLDGVSIVEGHEYAETLTDFFPFLGWSNDYDEDGDLCAWGSNGGILANVAMGERWFAMQSTWSNDTAKCEISHPIVPRPTQLTVIKNLVHPWSQSLRLFNLQIDGRTVAANVNSGSSGPQIVTPGTHIVGETGGTGTSLGAFYTEIGGACSADGTVTVPQGGNSTCTITNYDNYGGCPPQPGWWCAEPGDGKQGCLECAHFGHTGKALERLRPNWSIPASPAPKK